MNELVKKMKKSEEINANFDKIIYSILQQKKTIEKLEIIKNEALLNAKNNQMDIELLKKCISEVQKVLKPRSQTQQKSIPRSFINQSPTPARKPIYFTMTGMFKLQANEIVCSVKYSDNGYFFMYATCKTLYLYDSKTKACINTANIPYDENSVIEKITRSISISPSSSMAAVCAADLSVVLFKLPTLKIIGKIKANTSVASYFCFYNDNQRIAITGPDGNISLYSISTITKEKETFLGKGKYIVGISVTVDDSILVVTCSDGTVFIIDGQLTGKPQCYHESSDFVFSSCLSRMRDHLAVSQGNNAVKLYSLIGGFHHLKTLTGHRDYAVCVEFSPDGNLLISGSKDESIKIWNIETGENIWTIQLNENTVFCVSHNPKQNEFIVCTGDGIINIFSYIFNY